MKIEDKAKNIEDEEMKCSAPETDYRMECHRLWNEKYEQDTIIKALIFYIREGKNNEH
jgi:hypothetical protein